MRERGPAVWAGGGVSGAPQAALVRLGQRWRVGRTCRRVSGWPGARPSSLRTATQPSLSAERAHLAAGFDRSAGHSRARVARCRARLGRSALETFSAWREWRRHRLDNAAPHALNAATQRRVPQGNEGAPWLFARSPAARPDGRRGRRGKVSSHTSGCPASCPRPHLPTANMGGPSCWTEPRVGGRWCERRCDRRRRGAQHA